MVKNEEPAIKKAEDILEYLGSLEEVRRYYEAREMAIHDEITRTIGAREEGREEGKLEVAKKLISLGLDIQKIVEATGLSEEQIKKLSTEH